jgi:hypothetical protein
MHFLYIINFMGVIFAGRTYVPSFIYSTINNQETRPSPSTSYVHSYRFRVVFSNREKYCTLLSHFSVRIEKHFCVYIMALYIITCVHHLLSGTYGNHNIQLVELK